MREILFRAKLHDNSKWIEGKGTFTYEEGKRPAIDVLEYDETYKEYVVTSWVIIPETLGQFTGFTDKNGVKIFEGDICHFYGGEFYGGCWEANHICEIKLCYECLWYIENAEYVEVIGNIHDNPELLKESAT